MRTVHVLFALLVLSLCLPHLAFAQIINVTADQTPPIPGAGHDYIKMLSETVNPGAGSVSIRIGVPVPPSRGFTVPFSFEYDSNAALHWMLLGQPPGATATDNIGYLAQAGWTYVVPHVSYGIAAAMSGSGPQPNVCVYYLDYVLTDLGGQSHALGISSVSPPGVWPLCQGPAYNAATGQTMSNFLLGADPLVQASTTAPTSQTRPPVQVSDEHGLVYNITGPGRTPPGSTDPYGTGGGIAGALVNLIEDRNGNTASINDQGNGVFTVTDTSGRTALSSSGFGATGNTTITVSGLSNPYQVSWSSLPTASLPEALSTVTNNLYQGQGVPSDCNDSGTGNGTISYNSRNVITQITLPNGKSYQFQYDSATTLLNKMIYPTGGYVRYVWGLTTSYWDALYRVRYCQNEPGIRVADEIQYKGWFLQKRYVSFDGVHEVLEQDFAYNASWSSPDALNFTYWTQRTTTVTTKDLVRGTNYQTVYTYSPFPVQPQPNDSGSVIPLDRGPVTSVETQIQYYGTNGALLRTVQKTFVSPQTQPDETIILDNGQTSQTHHVYSALFSAGSQNSCQNANGCLLRLTDSYDYDYGPAAPGPLLRQTHINYASFPATAMFPSAPSVLDLPSQLIIYDGNSNKVAETDYTYDSPSGTATSGIVQHSAGCNCGNLTKVSKWLNSSGTTLSTTYTNDDTGQRLSMTDPRSDTTTYSYADSYSSGSPPGPTDAYLTQVTHPQTNGVNHTESFKYAYSDGQLSSSTDQNGQTTTYTYNTPPSGCSFSDGLDRLSSITYPDTGKTTYCYNDAPYNASTPSPSVTTTKTINSTTSLATVSATDGLGHPVTSLVTSDPQGTIHTDTTYDGLGRVYTVSNPYRTGTDPTTTTGTTTYGYDALSRKLTETYPDSSALTTAYCGPNTLVTDPTSRWRRSRVDGLGRLVEVDEPNAPGATVNSNGCPGTGEPIWATSYTLDTLGNLKTVVQNGSRQRNFTYDWTSRLLTANNPETGTITYGYDSDTNCASPNSFAGLLVSKVDARGIRTCAQYDALNRETVRNYSNGDHTITTTYDQPNCLGLSTCQNVGQRTNVTDPAGSEVWAYQVDATNKRSVHVEQRTTSGITKTSTYYLDLAGNVTQAVYPTGRVVNYTFDAANRPSKAADGSNGVTYANDFQTAPIGCLSGAVCYTPQGTFYALSIGQSSSFTGLNLTHTYNNRLQPNEFKASSTGGSAIDITYGFGDPVTSHNAGHVYAITNNLDTTRSQAFTYDSLNRISSALTTSTHATSPTHCWGENYTLDAWGNLTSIAPTTNSNYIGCSQESGFGATADGNNRLSIFAYDSSGSTQSDGTVSYTWDAESQLKSATSNNGTTNYTYDGDGRRASKVGSKLYWYGSGGDILAETDASGNTTAEYIFFGGKRVAMLPAGGNPIYYIEDMLGTSRVTTTNSGVVCYDADFYPYGGERAYTNTCPQNYKFEGKERDTETGNDDFGARYYSNRFGRWLSADWSAVPAPVPYANLTNPQTLNLYSMVDDDPESFADLDGHVESGRGGCSDANGVNGFTCYQPSNQNTQQTEIRCLSASGCTHWATNQEQQQEPVVVADGYTVDKFSHGGPHIDRVDDGGKLVGRYDENGNPIEFKGKTPPAIPRRDKKKFKSAADKLREYKERVKKANESQQSAPAPGKAPAKFQGFPNPNCAGPCDGSPYFVPLPAGPLPGLSVPAFGPVEIPVFVPA